MTLISTKIIPDLQPIENSVFGQYVESMLEDGDFNISNQVSSKRRWVVTKTYNHPDVHDNGLAVFWLPFFGYTKVLKSFSLPTSLGQARGYTLAQVIANLFYGLLTLILLSKIMQTFLQKKDSTKTLFFLSLGTPFIWYLIFHPFSSDITLSTLGALWFLFLIINIKNGSPLRWFLFGLLSATFFAAKISAVFFLTGLGSLLFLKRKSSLKELIKKALLPFGLGFTIILTALLINEWIKYGFVSYGYFALLNYDYYLLGETLWGPSGYLYVSPILILPIFGLLLNCYRFKLGDEQKIMVFLGLSFVVKTLLESLTFNGNNELGARHLIVDHTVICLLSLSFYNYLVEKFDKMGNLIGNIFSLFAITWMLIISLFYLSSNQKEHYSWGMSYLSELSSIVPYFHLLRYRFYEIFLQFGIGIKQLLPYFPLLLAASTALLLIFKKEGIFSEKTAKWLNLLSISSAGLYLIFTVTNFLQNPVNVEKQRKLGLYQNSIVASGMEMYQFDENNTQMLKTIKYAKLKGNSQIEKEVTQILKIYRSKAVGQIVLDPAQLKNGLLDGSLSNTIID
ncbi:MAG: hypothetical protein HN509_10730 [Halobacteriovoraceae bacterium]|nr:hypothetical protein [Halobacteriovoraceae bacterium]